MMRLSTATEPVVDAVPFAIDVVHRRGEPMESVGLVQFPNSCSVIMRRPVPDNTDERPVATEAAELDTLVAENKSLRERLLRALADAENTRQRADRAAEDTRKFAIADFARELLLVVDNLQRTVEAAENSGSAQSPALVEGVQATLRLLLRTLERFGIHRIDALGQHFDPNRHEAISAVNDPSRPPGTIVHVVDQGYMIHERLLRPARVVVTTQRAQTTPMPDDTDLGSEWGSSWVY
jgi:molecular chaperone GrpE